MATVKDVLAKANEYEKNKEYDKAEKFYQAVVDRMGDTKYAAYASERLSYLSQMKASLNQNDSLPSQPIDVAYYPALSVQDLDRTDLITVPISKLSVYGTVLASLPNIVKQSGAADVAKQVADGGEGLYQLTFPTKAAGGKLANFKDSDFMMGAIKRDGKIVGQARLTPYKETVSMPYDPTALFMGLAFINMDQKLNQIQKSQKKIMHFLEIKEMSKLVGDYHSLTEIASNYQYNWENETFIRISLNQVKNIKRDAKTMIEMYRNLVVDATKEEVFIKNDRQIQNISHEIQKNFRNYQLALYNYALAVYLDVLLLKNFESDYLEHVQSEINDYSKDYQELYEKCYQFIKNYDESTIEAKVLDGFAKVNRKMGHDIEQIAPLREHKINKHFEKIGHTADQFKNNRHENFMKAFEPYHDANISGFADTIAVMEKTHENMPEILMDEKNIYVKAM